MKASSARLPPFGTKLSYLLLTPTHVLGLCVFLRTPLLASCEVLWFKNPLRNLPRRGYAWRKPRGAGFLDGMSPGGTPWLLNESPGPRRPKHCPFQSQCYDLSGFFQHQELRAPFLFVCCFSQALPKAFGILVLLPEMESTPLQRKHTEAPF